MLDPQLRISAGKGLFLLVCWWVLLTVAASLLMGAIGTDTTSALRCAILVQDIAVFILPVVLTVMIVSPQPWRYIGLDTGLEARSTCLTAITAIVSIPAMNRLVAWNESIHLPWNGIEEALRQSENAAQAMVQRLMGGTSVWDLIIAILLMSKLGNKHLAIWSAAFIFSAVHLQFFGFVPRLLMGAYFGYLVVWSGSLRLSMFAHALNNSLVALNFWLVSRNATGNDLNELGTGLSTGSIIAAIVSLAATGLCVYSIFKATEQQYKK